MSVSSLIITTIFAAGVALRSEEPATPVSAQATSQMQIFVHARRVDEIALRKELALRLRHAEVWLWTRGNTAEQLPKIERSIWIGVEFVELDGNAKIRVIAGDGRIYERQSSARSEDVVATLARDLSTLLLAIENRSLVPESTTSNVVDEVEKARAMENNDAALEPTSPSDADPSVGSASEAPIEPSSPTPQPSAISESQRTWSILLGPLVRLQPTPQAVGGVYQGWGGTVAVGHDIRRLQIRAALSVAQRTRNDHQVWRERLLLAAGIGRKSQRIAWRWNLGPTIELWQANFNNTRQRPQNSGLGRAPSWLVGLALGGETAYRVRDDALAPRVSIGVRGELSASAAFDHGLRQIGLKYRDSAGRSTEVAQFGGLELGLSLFVAIEPR